MGTKWNLQVLTIEIWKIIIFQLKDNIYFNVLHVLMLN